MWLLVLGLVVILAGVELGCTKSYQQSQRAQRVEGKSNSSSIEPPLPSSERLLGYVQTQLSWGPRVPGTAAHDSCRRWLVTELRRWTDTVFEQPFQANVYGKSYQCTNILARLYPERPDRVLLCAHWDSRPVADEDPVLSHRTRPIPGANDGASGVAVLLELVRLLRENPLERIGIDIVLFDAEDMGARSDEAMFCLGSKHFARTMPFPVRPRYGILFDLVGDRDARFPIEYNSMAAAAPVVTRLWQLGARYGGGHFVQQIGGSVVDDHLPLIEIGIPTVDIIDIELVGNRAADERRRYWHTLSDDMRNISGETMSSVARVVLALLYSDSPLPL